MPEILSSNYAQVAYANGSWNLDRVHSVEVIGAQGLHEIAILTYGYPRSDSVVPPEKTQVTITYGRKATGLRTFYGYVNHFEPDGDRGAGTIRVWCIGTSLPLNSANPYSWTNVSASYVARVIAQRYQLRPVLTRTREIISHWAQGNENDFEMMNRLAARAGVKFWVTGGSLYFLDPTTLLTEAQQTPRLVMNGRADDTLLKVGGVVGSLAPEDTPAVNYVYGLKNSSNGTDVFGTLVKASSIRSTLNAGMTLGSNTNVVNMPTTSAAEAQSIVDAATNVGSWVTVSAYVNPTEAIEIGDVVTLEGSKCPGPLSGVWVVCGTDEKHVFITDGPTRQGSARTCVLTLMRNQQYAHTFASPGLFEGKTPITPAISINGTWQAAQQGEIYV